MNRVGYNSWNLLPFDDVRDLFAEGRANVNDIAHLEGNFSIKHFIANGDYEIVNRSQFGRKLWLWVLLGLI